MVYSCETWGGHKNESTRYVCVNSSLVYSCETWGGHKNETIETLHRSGIRKALSVRNGINNEILYIGSGRYPLYIRIKKKQIKFWRSLSEFITDDHYIGKLVKDAKNHHVEFMHYYKDLYETYETPKNCKNHSKTRV